MAAVFAMLTGCGGGSDPALPDAAQSDAPSIDAPEAYPACREFAGTPATVPAHIVGSLDAPDVQSPQCASVEAPYGIESAGPDSVIPLGGLTPGTAYIVQLRSTADLAFYVATGCSTPSGPSTGECPLFVDASAAGEEVGRFVATASTAYVVVDYYGSHTPANQSFTLDVYAEACTDDSGCASGLPVCFHGRCVECADSFDCSSVDAPRCDTLANTCVAGVDTCDTDDSSEPDDDGPAGAVALVLDTNGTASAMGQICSSPRTESDYFSFEVTDIGQTWDLSLAWTGTRDLDIGVYAASGAEIGLSYWEKPETIRLTYLPVGTYYVRITDFASSATSVPYTLTAQRTQGTGCTTRADCATEYRNQLFRGDCQAGACVSIAGNGAVAQGGACDSVSDCASGLSCPSFYFAADADTRDVCTPGCSSDADCSALGADYVCTGYLITNICVQKCTSDDHCPVALDSKPVSGPWYRLRCQASTGRCVP